MDCDRTAALRLADEFWADPQTVAKFASRDADHRLLRMLAEHKGSPPRVLDLGCAGGRNAQALAEAGADLHAVDRSPAMVEKTRSRVAHVLGCVESKDRIRQGTMEDLGHLSTASFDWVVALGVYPSAPDRHAYDQALAESARIIRVGGTLLFSAFGPRSQPEGRPLESVPGEKDVYRWAGGRRSVFLGPDALDQALDGQGFRPSVPTTTVRVPMGEGFRITINARYVRVESPAPLA